MVNILIVVEEDIVVVGIEFCVVFFNDLDEWGKYCFFFCVIWVRFFIILIVGEVVISNLFIL